MLPWYMCKSIPLAPETTKTQARWIEVDPIYRDYCAELLPEINCAKATNLSKHNLNERHKEQSDRFYMVWSNWPASMGAKAAIVRYSQAYNGNYKFTETK